MSDKTDYVLKILTIGESAVGKTCILLRFTDNKFLKNHITTIGIDYKSKIIKSQNKSIKLKIWDTAGQERFRNITKQYYNGADGILLVYDVTDRNSFEKVREWMKQIQENTQKSNIGIVLIGNKCDLEDRQVTNDEGVALAKEYGILFWETSAFKDINIKESIEGLTNLIISKKLPDEETRGKGDKVIIIDGDERKKNESSSGCCK